MLAGRRGGPPLVVLVVLLVVVIFGSGDEQGGDRDGPTGSGPGSPGGAAEVDDVEVLRIVDGDTIEVRLDGRVEDVRYIGIDTPESVKPDSPVECFGPEASRRNSELVAGEQVRLEFDAERRDRFGRLLAYVFADGELVNAELIAEGFATTLEIAPNTSRADQFERLEREASAAGRGLWAAC